jgi:hypothetical protein
MFQDEEADDEDANTSVDSDNEAANNDNSFESNASGPEGAEALAAEYVKTKSYIDEGGADFDVSREESSRVVVSGGQSKLRLC